MPSRKKNSKSKAAGGKPMGKKPTSTMAAASATPDVIAFTAAVVPPSPRPPPTTISDLPHEILEHIFYFTVAPFDYHQTPYFPPAQTLRRIASICLHWRSIALGMPSLWADAFDFDDNVAWHSKIALKRAGRSPLTMVLPPVSRSLTKCPSAASAPRLGDLIMRWDCQYSPGYILYYAHKFTRLCRTAVLKIPEETWSDFSQGLHVDSFAKLEALTLVRTGSGPVRSTLDVTFVQPELMDSSVVVVAPAVEAPVDVGSAVGDAAPATSREPDSDSATTAATAPEPKLAVPPALPWNLRILDLRGCGTSFGSRAFRLLEELTVHDLPIDVALDPTAWINILKDMPNIRRLELVNATLTEGYYMAKEEEVCSYSKTAINLPQLEYFKMDAPLHHCSSFLSFVVIPTTCDLLVVGNGFSALKEAFHSTMTSVEKQFAGDVARRMFGKKLQVAVTKNSCIVRTPGHLAPEQLKNTPLFDLTMHWNAPTASGRKPINPQDVFSATMLAVQKACGDVADLELLCDITINRGTHKTIIEETLGGFRNTRRLKCVTEPTVVFLLPLFHSLPRTASVVADGGGGGGGGGTVKLEPIGDFLPMLNSISFYAVNFTKLASERKKPLGGLVSFVQRRRHLRKKLKNTEDKPGEYSATTPSAWVSGVSFYSCVGVFGNSKAVMLLEGLSVQVVRDGFSFGQNKTIRCWLQQKFSPY